MVVGVATSLGTWSRERWQSCWPPVALVLEPRRRRARDSRILIYCLACLDSSCRRKAGGCVHSRKIRTKRLYALLFVPWQVRQGWRVAMLLPAANSQVVVSFIRCWGWQRRTRGRHGVMVQQVDCLTHRLARSHTPLFIVTFAWAP